MLTHDVLLDLFMGLGLAGVLGLSTSCLLRRMAHRRSTPQLRLTLLRHVLH